MQARTENVAGPVPLRKGEGAGGKGRGTEGTAATQKAGLGRRGRGRLCRRCRLALLALLPSRGRRVGALPRSSGALLLCAARRRRRSHSAFQLVEGVGVAAGERLARTPGCPSAAVRSGCSPVPSSFSTSPGPWGSGSAGRAASGAAVRAAVQRAPLRGLGGGGVAGGVWRRAPGVCATRRAGGAGLRLAGGLPGRGAAAAAGARRLSRRLSCCRRGSSGLPEGEASQR